MIVRAIAFTQAGQAWEEKLGFPVERGVPVKKWTQEHFASSDALLYIGACGIAVRAIAPYVKDKLSDPAVIVMDEMGRHVIPLLSGHVGGANELALDIAARTGASNPGAIKQVSGALLAGQRIGVAISERTIKPPFPVTLTLRPRTLALGAGCKKGLDESLFEERVREFLDKNGVSLLSVRALATIDLKQNEAAFLRFCEKYRLPLLTYSAEELKALPGVFAHSDFVERTVGVGNVCERAAAMAGGRLLIGKTVSEGLTLALAGEMDG